LDVVVAEAVFEPQQVPEKIFVVAGHTNAIQATRLQTQLSVAMHCRLLVQQTVARRGWMVL
jgi:hypothetical protein